MKGMIICSYSNYNDSSGATMIVIAAILCNVIIE